jgi:hypothetical protein
MRNWHCHQVGPFSLHVRGMGASFRSRRTCQSFQSVVGFSYGSNFKVRTFRLTHQCRSRSYSPQEIAESRKQTVTAQLRQAESQSQRARPAGLEPGSGNRNASTSSGWITKSPSGLRQSDAISCPVVERETRCSWCHRTCYASGTSETLVPQRVFRRAWTTRPDTGARALILGR